MIQRYDVRWFLGHLVKEEDGDVVRYTDHAAIIAEKDARIEEAINLSFKYGQIDGGHHRAWVIDQLVRILAGKRYDALIEEYCNGEDGETYYWDEGIAP